MKQQYGWLMRSIAGALIYFLIGMTSSAVAYAEPITPIRPITFSPSPVTCQNNVSGIKPVSSQAQTLLMESTHAEQKLPGLRQEFSDELAGSGLQLMDTFQADAVAANALSIRFVATSPLDLDHTGKVALVRDYLLTPVTSGSGQAMVVDTGLAVNTEEQTVEISMRLDFREAIDSHLPANSTERVAGLKIDKVGRIPLAEYRSFTDELRTAPDRQAVVDRVKDRFASELSATEQTTVTNATGASVGFFGQEKDLTEVVGKLVPGMKSLQTDNIVQPVAPQAFKGLGCVVNCLKANLGAFFIARAVCIGTLFALCGIACFFVGPACLACFRAGLLACGIGVGIPQVISIAVCLIQRCR